VSVTRPPSMPLGQSTSGCMRPTRVDEARIEITVGTGKQVALIASTVSTGHSSALDGRAWARLRCYSGWSGHEADVGEVAVALGVIHA